MAAIDPKRTMGITKKTKKATPQKTPDQIAAEQDAIRKRFAELTPKPIESVAQAGPQETRDILAQRKDMLAGFNAPQLAAMQAQMAGGQQAAQQQRERALQSALAKQGVKGGAAASLQAQAAQQASREKAQMDTDLMLKQTAQQEKALGAYEQGVTGSLDLAQKQQFAGLAAQLAGEQTISAEKIAQLQADATKAYGQQMETAANKGSGGCCTILAMIGAGAAASGVSEAKANELILASKNKGITKEMLELNIHESKLWDDLSYVRAARDNLCSDIEKRGYYVFSEKVEPIIQKNKLIKHVGYSVLVKPLIEIGKGSVREGKPSLFSKLAGKTWIKIFGLFATDKPFTRKNGEVV